MNKSLSMILAALMMSLMFVACSDDDDNKPSEIDVADYANYMPATWEDGYATRYFCDDNTFYFDYTSATDVMGTWAISGSVLTISYSTGSSYVYTIDAMYEDEIQLTSSEGAEITYDMESDDGCYWLDADDYAAAVVGKWEDENSIMWYCGDNTYHTEFESGSTSNGTWYFEGSTLVKLSSTGSTYYYTMDYMTENWMQMTSNSSGTSYHADLLSTDGCYVAPEGSAVFYLTEDCGCGTVDVSIDGTYYGTVSSFFPDGADCGADGAVTATLEPGEYSVYAECEGFYWEFTTTITDGGCTKEQLSCSKKVSK